MCNESKPHTHGAACVGESAPAAEPRELPNTSRRDFLASSAVGLAASACC
jgi:hypothetical protein